MNIHNFSTKKGYTAPEKKSKSTNRVPLEKGYLPSLKAEGFSFLPSLASFIIFN